MAHSVQCSFFGFLLYSLWVVGAGAQTPREAVLPGTPPGGCWVAITAPPPGWLPFSLPRRVGGRGRPEPGSLLLTRLLPHWSRLPSTHPRAFASAVPHARDTLPTDLVSFLGDTCCSYPGVSVFEWQQLRPAQVREAESPPGAALLCVLDLVWSPP